MNTTVTGSMFNSTMTPPSHTPWNLVWLYGFLATTGINLTSILGALSYFCVNPKLYTWILMAMIAIGVGSMVTVSVMNLIPQVLEHQGESVGELSVVMISIYVFCISDQILKLIRMKKSNTHQTTVSEICVLNDENDGMGENWFTAIDGLTIGATFAGEHAKTGLNVFLAILFEEIPCELGDFAIFLKAGISTRYAILLNLIGASPNYIGLIVGILIGNLHHVHIWIYAIAAGMFLYISLGVMLSELVDLQMTVAKFGIKQDGTIPIRGIISSFTVQNIAMLAGFIIQLLIIKFA
ncbi:hypothetical protein ACOME3_002437 [Neoechinorhynchus agilis]